MAPEASVKKIDRWAKRWTPQAVGNIIAAKHLSGALKTIEPRHEKILEEIKKMLAERLAKMKNPNIFDFCLADEASDHRKFKKTWQQDVSSISMTLFHCVGPKEFYAPIIGGDAFLEHLFICDYCLLMLSEDIPSSEEYKSIEKILSGYLNEALRISGVKETGLSGGSIENDLKFPKPS